MFSTNYIQTYIKYKIDEIHAQTFHKEYQKANMETCPTTLEINLNLNLYYNQIPSVPTKMAKCFFKLSEVAKKVICNYIYY